MLNPRVPWAAVALVESSIQVPHRLCFLHAHNNPGLCSRRNNKCVELGGGFGGIWDQSRETHLLSGQAEKKRRRGGEVREAPVALIKCRVAGCWVARLAVTLDPGGLYEPKRHRRTLWDPWLPIDLRASEITRVE